MPALRFLSKTLSQTLPIYCRIIINREAGEIIRLVASACPFVCLSVCLSFGALLLEPFDLDFWSEGLRVNLYSLPPSASGSLLVLWLFLSQIQHKDP